MKKLISFIFIFFCFMVFAQKNITTDYRATYVITYKFNKQEAKEETILFMNAKTGESYFIGTNNYLLQKALAKKTQSEESLMRKYTSNFNEMVYNKNQQLTVFEQIVNAKVVYKETPKIKWTITNETKKHNNIVVKKAYANAFGRKWYAWFTDEMPLPFAPYKFVGLPGLILVLQDEKEEFLISLTRLEKKENTTVLPSLKKYKTIKKSKVEEIKYNQHVVHISQIVLFDDPTKRREYKKRLEKVFHFYPRLDIEFPYQD